MKKDKDLKIGFVDYSIMGFLSIGAILALVRAILLLPSDMWGGLIGGLIVGLLVIGIGIFICYWVGKAVVYLLSFTGIL